MNSTLEMNFGNPKEPKQDFVIFEKIIRDRKSIYSVSVGKVKNREEVKTFLKKLKSKKSYDQATHHSYGVIIASGFALYETKSDDGETGAGMVILRIMKKRGFVNIIVCVTRWFGGIKLGTDRFRHIQDSTIFALDRIEKTC